MLYEMIGGELPFMAKSAVALMMKHLTVVPAKLRDRFPKLQIPESVDAVVLRLLEKEKPDRFPSMREVEAALQHELDRLRVQRGERVMLTSATARRLTAEGGSGSRLLVAGRKVPLWAVVSAVVLLMVAGVLGGVRLLRPRPAPPREELPPAELLALRTQALQVVLQGLRGSETELKLDALVALGQTHDVALRPPIEAELGAPSAVVQAQAAEALGQLGERAAVTSLAALLDKSKDAMVLAAAAEALQLLGDERGPGVLGQLLREPEPDGQFRAAMALAESGNQDAQSKLLAYLARGGVPDARRLRVLATLARGGEPTAVPTLQRLMATPGPIELRLSAAAKLAQLGEESGRLFLREQTHKQGASQLSAARLLAEPEEAEALELLRRVISERRSLPAARLLATEGLGRGGDSLDARLLAPEILPEVPAPLRQAAAISVLQIAGRDPNTLSAQSLLWAREAMADRDWTVREAAVAALGDSDSPAALELLRRAATDQAARVRQAAVRSLGRQATAGGRELLLAALADAEAAVRVESLRSLLRIAPTLQQRGETSLSALQGSMGQVFASRPPLEQALAVGVLLRLGDREQLTRLRTLLKDADPHVRRTATEQLTAPEHTDLLIAQLADEDFTVRFIAARKLGAHGDKRALPVLKEALRRGGGDGLLAYAQLNKLGEPGEPPADFDRAFAAATLTQRLEVVDALGELPPELALPPLRRAARDAEAAVRRKVAEIAALLRGPEAAPLGLPLLRQLLGDRDGSVRARAAALLGRLLAAGKPKLAAAPPSPSPADPLKDSAPDAGTHHATTAPVTPETGGDEGPATAGRGRLLVETPPGVHFQIDGGPYQTATKVPLPLAAGRHLVNAISGVQEVIIKANTTQTIHIEASQAEQLFRDGRDNFNKPDFTKASRQLEKANALCARDHKHVQACAGLTLEASYLLGKIYLSQHALPEAMTAFQRVVEREANLRGKNTQKAEAVAAIEQLKPQLGQIILTQKKGKRCQEDVIWQRPGQSQLYLDGEPQTFTVKAGQVIRRGACD